MSKPHSSESASTPGKSSPRVKAISDAGLSTFRSEDAPLPEDAPQPDKSESFVNSPHRREWHLKLVLPIAAVLVVAVIAGLYSYSASASGSRTPATPSAVPAGHVTLDTRPAGADVSIDGQPHGVTPLTIMLPAGHHDVVLRRGTEERLVPLEISAGAQVTQVIEFAAAPASTTRLSVVTEPAGIRVAIDGEPRGTSPLTIENVSVGRHKVSVTSPEGSAERTVTTEPGATTSVVFTSLSKAPELGAGWLTVDAGFDINVVERDEVIGTSASSKIMMATGHHELDLVNARLGYRTHKSIDILTGKNIVVRIDARAPLNANARPWAEVTIDGNPVGVTPIAALVLPLGNHQVVFRHPDLGERREDIVITQTGPNRVAVDLAK